MNKEIETNNITELPMIATRGMLAFPQMTLSFDVEREASVRAADEADGSLYWKDTVSVSMNASEFVEDVAYPVSRLVDAEGTMVGYVMCTRLLAAPREQGSLLQRHLPCHRF